MSSDADPELRVAQLPETKNEAVEAAAAAKATDEQVTAKSATSAPPAAAAMPNSLALVGYKLPTGLFSFLSSSKLLIFVLNKGYVTMHTHDKLEGTRDASLATRCEWEVEDAKQCTAWAFDPSKSPCVGMVTLAGGGELVPDKDEAKLEVTVRAGSQGEDTCIRFLCAEDKARFCELCQQQIDHSKGDMMAKLQQAMKERNLNIIG